MGVRLISTPRVLLGLLGSVVLAAGVLLGLDAGRKSSAADTSTLPDTSLRSMEAVLRRDGLDAALDSLERRAARDSAVLRDGHQMAHALGREAVAQHGGDAAIIKECRPSFASGCYHGVVEAAVHHEGRIDMAGLERLCVSMDESGAPAPGFECLHGLGHGVLGAVARDLAATLRHCDALSIPRRAASCHSGAFMEAITGAMGPPMAHEMHAHAPDHAHGAAQPLAIDPADPYSPCDGYRDPYATSCWLFQGYVILRANAFDAGRALRICDGAPDGRTARCYESIGHQLTGLFQRGDAWILGECAKGNPALAARCAGGATLALNATDWSGRRAIQLCTAAREAWKDVCYRTAAGALVDLATPEQRASLCATVEAAYVRSCREAAEVGRMNEAKKTST
jgi:hypothetical protein